MLAARGQIDEVIAYLRERAGGTTSDTFFSRFAEEELLKAGRGAEAFNQYALWAAAGSIDTGLSFLSLLELYGTEIAERRMPALRVVEAFDVIEHV